MSSNNNVVDYYYKQPFLSIKDPNQIWILIDITESESLLKNNGQIQIIAHLFNSKTRKIKRISFSDLDSNFTAVESGLAEEAVKLNRILKLDYNG